MATIIEQAPPAAFPNRTSTPPPHLTLNTSVRGTPAAVPNKHIPHCSPGRVTVGLTTPPTSPPPNSGVSRESEHVLYPPHRFSSISDFPTVYAIGAAVLAEALNHHGYQPLPDTKHVFPWLHGLHADNAIQLAFFVARRKALRRIPPGLRGITIVKAGGDLSRCRLKGAISPDELLVSTEFERWPSKPRFHDIDPSEGFCIRNFQIQACKIGTVSDVVVYADDKSKVEDVVALAKNIAFAQKSWRDTLQRSGLECGEFNTFVVLDSFETFEQHHQELVAIDSNGIMTGNVVDFFYMERKEMAEMTRASEIAPNVFLGPTPDPAVAASAHPDHVFDIYIEASDLAQLPDSDTLQELSYALDDSIHRPIRFEVPSSGSIMPPTWNHSEVDGLLNLCRWIWKLTSEDAPPAVKDNLVAEKAEEVHIDADGDIEMTICQIPSKRKKVLIHCADGYTESTLLGLTYFMYAHGVAAHEAWVRMHKEFGRNFFAYSSDVALLTGIQTRIIAESPTMIDKHSAPNGVCSELEMQINAINSTPEWVGKFDGSLPSKILAWMYLGNLTHANNPHLLRELGIKRILSVGEKVNWAKTSSMAATTQSEISSGLHFSELSQDGFEILSVENVQDNGVDGLMSQFEKCLEFIERGKGDSSACLVHCRVGVSRSATICIAEVMREFGMSFPRAYCFVRARRLNVIIQPNLRLTYELLKWEEALRVQRGEPLRRELEWPTVAREIAAMNKPYSRG